jgi:hypothetical protein
MQIDPGVEGTEFSHGETVVAGNTGSCLTASHSMEVADRAVAANRGPTDLAPTLVRFRLVLFGLADMGVSVMDEGGLKIPRHSGDDDGKC